MKSFDNLKDSQGENNDRFDTGSTTHFITGFEKKKASIDWVIEDFQVHQMRILDKALPKGQVDFLESPPISPLHLPGSWSVRLYPVHKNKITSRCIGVSFIRNIFSSSENKKEKSGRVGLFIRGITPVDTNISFSFAIIGDDEEVLFEKSSGNKFFLCSSKSPNLIGFSNFIACNETAFQSLLCKTGSLRLRVNLQLFTIDNSNSKRMQPGINLLQDVGNFLHNELADFSGEYDDLRRHRTIKCPVMNDAVFVVTKENEKVFCSKFLLCVRVPAARCLLEKRLSKSSREFSSTLSESCLPAIIEIEENRFSTRVVENFVSFLHFDICPLLSHMIVNGSVKKASLLQTGSHSKKLSTMKGKSKFTGTLVKQDDVTETENFLCSTGKIPILRRSNAHHDLLREDDQSLCRQKYFKGVRKLEVNLPTEEKNIAMHVKNSFTRSNADNTMITVPHAETPFNLNELLQLYRMAFNYQFHHLFKACSIALLMRINLATADAINLVAMECCSPVLKKAASKFLCFSDSSKLFASFFLPNYSEDDKNDAFANKKEPLNVNILEIPTEVPNSKKCYETNDLNSLEKASKKNGCESIKDSDISCESAFTLTACNVVCSENSASQRYINSIDLDPKEISKSISTLNDQINNFESLNECESQEGENSENLQKCDGTSCSQMNLYLPVEKDDIERNERTETQETSNSVNDTGLDLTSINSKKTDSESSTPTHLSTSKAYLDHEQGVIDDHDGIEISDESMRNHSEYFNGTNTECDLLEKVDGTIADGKEFLNISSRVPLTFKTGNGILSSSATLQDYSKAEHFNPRDVETALRAC